MRQTNFFQPEATRPYKSTDYKICAPEFSNTMFIEYSLDATAFSIDIRKSHKILIMLIQFKIEIYIHVLLHVPLS